MLSIVKVPVFQLLGFILLSSFLYSQASIRHYTFVVEDTPYTRLCSTKNILTVNGQFPGPTLYVNKGDTLIVDVYNKANYNITIHWHGVKQPRNPWSDGPEYITQCPIRSGERFSQKIILSSEEGTLWWHAHSDWSRATVHGAVVIYPNHNKGSGYPFPKPHADVPIVFGEWWKEDIVEVYNEFRRTGADPNISDAYTINGQPGDLYPCSKSDTYKLTVDQGKTYLLRLINAAVEDILFFAITNHQLTVVGTDGSYTKPFKTDYITISPGQTIDVLLETNQPPSHYYMAARVYSSAEGVDFDNTTTTALLQYNIGNKSTTLPSNPPLPYLPFYNDTKASVNFTGKLRSLANEDHPINVPVNISSKLIFTVSVNTFPCENNSCGGPNGSRLAASMNNISFNLPSTDILKAYYNNISGVYGSHFPSKPPLVFNFTAENLPTYLNTPKKGTEVRVVEYNSTVEIVLQGTNLLAGTDHPMHLHGYSFYVVGWGFGNFDKEKDPLGYNLVDPPLQNTIAVPKNGWAAIRFKANNPGVWFMHCHLDRHTTWGMEMAFIVKNGQGPDAQMLPPLPPPPAAAAAAPPPPSVPYDNTNRPTHDEVRTIFITGLPDDVKERELQNLLRWLPGYEASQVNYKGEKPMGFALFSTGQLAVAAKDALQEMLFDAETKSVLHTEMAKKNLFVKRGIVADSNVYDQSKRLRTGGDYTHTGYTAPSPFHPPPAPVWGPHGYMAPAPPPYDPYAGYPVPPVPMPAPAAVQAPSSYVPVQNTKDNPPCNTLFIGNLGENINEEELRGLISAQPGFKQMKILRQERHTVCFIEFEDVNTATNVHHNLQGAVIPSSGSVGMRIQYSKNPFGKRKDGVHPIASPAANGAPPAMTYQ